MHTMGIPEKIKAIQDEMSKTQINKATEHHIGILKAKIAKLRREQEDERTFEIKDGVKLLEDAGHKVSLTDSQYAFHINSHGVDKGSGLREAMHMLAVESKDLIAIGDSITDVPMFNVAKTSIALGNASEYVRSKATMTVDSKAGDGLLDAMDLLGPKMAGSVQ